MGGFKFGPHLEIKKVCACLIVSLDFWVKQGQIIGGHYLIRTVMIRTPGFWLNNMVLPTY